MSDLTKFEGWDLDTTSAGLPRVRDIEIGERACLAQPADIRRVIDKNWEELTTYGEIKVVALNAKTSGGRPGREYRLTEEQAVALMSMLKTPTARLLRMAMVRLFVAYRRAELAAPEPATVQLEIAHGPRVGEVPNLRADISSLCAMTARASGQSVSKVHGFVRKTYRVPGIHHVAVVVWPAVKATLEQIALGRISIGPMRRALPADRRQLDMWKTN